jgi:hypothetical protein
MQQSEMHRNAAVHSAMLHAPYVTSAPTLISWSQRNIGRRRRGVLLLTQPGQF